MDDFDDSDLMEDDSDLHTDPGETKQQTGLPGSNSVPGTLYRVKISHSSELVYGYSETLTEIKTPCMAVLNTRYGHDMGKVLGKVSFPGFIDQEELMKIDHLATEEDIAKWKQNHKKEIEAFQVCRQKIESHRLDMKLVSSHYMLDEPKILFFFTAEARVDFRDLVKDLVSVFKMRIELRQIGVRDESRVLGGCGVCGRVLCCHGISDKLHAVSIKMAKDQNLSLNSIKISGPCGRLLCCLSYEAQFYRDERRNLPMENTRFEHDGVTFRVQEMNIVKGRIKLHGEDGSMLEMSTSRLKRNENGKWTINPEIEPGTKSGKETEE